MTSEIPSSGWAEFFLKFNELNRNSLITLEHQDLEGHRREIAQNMPFEGIHFRKDDCNDRVIIGIGSAPGQRDLDHEIVEPIHVRIKGEQGDRKYIQVEAENGITFIIFHNGRFPLDYEGVMNKNVPEKEGSRERLAGVQGR